MPAKIVYPNPHIDATLGRVAIQRGPLVYAFEDIDNTAPIRQLCLVHGKPLSVEDNSALAVKGISASGVRLAEQAELYSTVSPYQASVSLHAIPYYSWGNRGHSQMAIWLPFGGCPDLPPPQE